MRLKKQVGVFGVIDFLLLLLFLFLSTLFHEGGHAFLAIMLGGQIEGINVIALFPEVVFTASQNNAVHVRYFGGLVSAIMIGVLLLAMNKWLERNKHYILKGIILAVITWQTSLGIIEGYDYSSYSSMAANRGLNIIYVLFNMPAVFVMSFYLFCKLRRPDKKTSRKPLLI